MLHRCCRRPVSCVGDESDDDPSLIIGRPCSAYPISACLMQSSHIRHRHDVITSDSSQFVAHLSSLTFHCPTKIQARVNNNSALSQAMKDARVSTKVCEYCQLGRSARCQRAAHFVVLTARDTHRFGALGAIEAIAKVAHARHYAAVGGDVGIDGGGGNDHIREGVCE